MTEESAAFEFEGLLDYIKRNRGFDFTGYKRPSLTRRVRKRMQIVGVDSYTEYVDYLEVHPDEFMQLFNTILINVTSFFRDPAAWEYLKDEVIPRIAEEKSLREQIRVWVAGCAGGHEAYTTAMVLLEALGEDRFRESVKIYATDVDDNALAQARQALYSPADVATIPEPLIERYFEPINGSYGFRKDLRRNAIFGRNDLSKDAPISRVDLLVCRNTLMYFNSEAQGRILGHFHFALNPNGYLFLGKGEMLLTRAHVFTPVDLRRRVFAKVSGGISTRPNAGNDLEYFAPEMNGMVERVRLREAAFDAYPIAQIVVGSDDKLQAANDLARSMFRLGPKDNGRPLHELDISYRPVEMRPLIAQVRSERKPVDVSQVDWVGRAGVRQVLDVAGIPLQDVHGNLLGVAVNFTDVTRYRRLQEELERSRQELETAYEELQSTVEELETTNEELQSTNEELETTNEELQSSNEELETMNEELQSTNEELESINTELRDRTTQLNEVNSFMGAILGSVRVAVVVLDCDVHVQTWNAAAEDLWGLRENEVRGKNFLNLDIGLPVDRLRSEINSCLSGESEVEESRLEAINRRGRRVECRVTISPLVYRASQSEQVGGAILLIEERPLQGAEATNG